MLRVMLPDIHHSSFRIHHLELIMPTVKVRNLKNEEVGDLELSDAVFGAELNESLIHAAVKAYLAGARQGTVGTKTKEFVGALATLGVEGKTLIVDTIDNDNLVLASRNVKSAKVVGAGGVNIYDVLYHEKLVLSRSAAEQLQAALDPKKASAAASATEEAEGEAEEGTREEEAA